MTKKAIDTPRKVFAILWHCLHLQGNITPGKVKFTMKNSSAYKPNQQINGKEGKGKKRNDSGVAFEQALSSTWRAQRADIYTLKLNVRFTGLFFVLEYG